MQKFFSFFSCKKCFFRIISITCFYRFAIYWFALLKLNIPLPFSDCFVYGSLLNHAVVLMILSITMVGLWLNSGFGLFFWIFLLFYESLSYLYYKEMLALPSFLVDLSLSLLILISFLSNLQKRYIEEVIKL